MKLERQSVEVQFGVNTSVSRRCGYLFGVMRSGAALRDESFDIL